MVDTRRAARRLFTKPAVIMHGPETYPCVIRDLSTSGARIEVDGASRLPDSFTLMIGDYELKLTCRIVWRRPYHIGVRFE